MLTQHPAIVQQIWTEAPACHTLRLCLLAQAASLKPVQNFCQKLLSGSRNLQNRDHTLQHQRNAGSFLHLLPPPGSSAHEFSATRSHAHLSASIPAARPYTSKSLHPILRTLSHRTSENKSPEAAAPAAENPLLQAPHASPCPSHRTRGLDSAQPHGSPSAPSAVAAGRAA